MKGRLEVDKFKTALICAMFIVAMLWALAVNGKIEKLESLAHDHQKLCYPSAANASLEDCDLTGVWTAQYLMPREATK